MKTNIFTSIILVLMFTSSTFAQNGIIINSGTKMELSAGTTLIIGNDFDFTNNSTNSIFNGTVVFAGTTLQEIGGSESTEFSVLDIDNSSGVLLSVDTRVLNELMLTTGVLDIGNLNMTLSDVSLISGEPFSADKMINANGNGKLVKEISGNDYFLLPVGDLTSGADYTPVEFDFTSGTYTGGSLSVGVKNEKHVNNLSTTNYLNRFWTLSSTGISDFSCDVGFYYVPGDIVGNEANIFGAIRNNDTWSSLGQVSSNMFSGTINNFADVTGVEDSQVGLINILNEKLEVYSGNGIIFINNPEGLNLKNIEIFDAVGRLISMKDINSSRYEEIHLSNASGYYFLKINTEGASIFKKVLID